MVYKSGGGRFVSIKGNFVRHAAPTLTEASNDQDHSVKLEGEGKERLEHIVEDKKAMERVMRDLSNIKIKKKVGNKFKKPIVFD